MVHQACKKDTKMAFSPNYGTSQSGAASAPPRGAVMGSGGFGMNQVQKQSQQLVLTPQLQQAIKILQYSNAELEIFVGDELNRNPLLERPQESTTTATVSDADRPFQASSSASQQALGDGSMWQRANRKSAFSDSDDDWLSQLSQPKLSLRDHLSDQIQEIIVHPHQCVIAMYLLDTVDDAGYIHGSWTEIAGTLGVDNDAVEQVLHLLQECEPAGVFARDLAECLSLQLQEKEELTAPFATMLQHLDLVAEGKLQPLAKLCAVPLEQMKQMVQRLRRLNPKPGLAFGGDPGLSFGPDVVIRAVTNGQAGNQFSVELNPDTLPNVLVNINYYQQVKDRARNKDDMRYLEECLQSANWLTKAMHQRAITIMKVVSEIVRQQEAFLQHGLAYLKPMTLKDIAQAVEVHESTVSRVTANKTALTPRGVISLKLFFSSKLGGEEAGGWIHSAGAIKDQIRKLVAAEGQTGKILSDDALAAELAKTGVTIARRTVAKYREALGIPDSALRKRAKKQVGG